MQPTSGSRSSPPTDAAEKDEAFPFRGLNRIPLHSRLSPLPETFRASAGGSGGGCSRDLMYTANDEASEALVASAAGQHSAPFPTKQSSHGMSWLYAPSPTTAV